MGGPGDRASKRFSLGGPTHSVHAEGHDDAPTRADVEQPSTSGSKSSARPQLPSEREPGGLGGAPHPVVGKEQGRKGKEPQPEPVAAEESDTPVVPKKSPKTRVTPVETMEGRGVAKRISAARNASPTQRGNDALTALQRIGERAKIRPKEKWTNLLNHIRVSLLKQAYFGLRKDAARGVDAMSWNAYGEQLDERLRDLEDRVHRGSYHPQPVRRVHIPKGDGRTRPLGIPALEDKIVQQAARLILEPIYEAEFVGISYGFRYGRSQHQALDALATAIGRKVSWVLDADIRSFFDTIDHGWMQKFIEHRIGDTRMVRLLMKWMRTGVMEDGELHAVEEGTPQGGIISPLLANIYLHYALDLWVTSWRKRLARGEVYVVRYADDFVMAFQYEQDARAMHQALAARMVQFGLELHPGKTRVLRFGRFAAQNQQERGLGKPETFDFLGFTHIAGRSRQGAFQLLRRTSRKKRRAKLASLKGEMRERRHHEEAEQYAWLSKVLVGHYRYYGVPSNFRALACFRHQVAMSWYRSLQRRSQRAKWNVAKLRTFQARFPLPQPRICHPWPEQRFAVR